MCVCVCMYAFVCSACICTVFVCVCVCMCVCNPIQCYEDSLLKNLHNIEWDRYILTIINVLALPETSYERSRCINCSKEYTDIACHIICECSHFMEERNILWDFIIDTLDVQRSVAISCMEDKLFTDSILGRKWTGVLGSDVLG